MVWGIVAENAGSDRVLLLRDHFVRPILAFLTSSVLPKYAPEVGLCKFPAQRETGTERDALIAGSSRTAPDR